MLNYPPLLRRRHRSPVLPFPLEGIDGRLGQLIFQEEGRCGMLRRTVLNESAARKLFSNRVLRTVPGVLLAAKSIFGHHMLEHFLHQPGKTLSRLVTRDGSGRIKHIYNNEEIVRDNMIFDIDFFALNFLRSVSNACLTTGKNLRAEKHLHVSIQGIGAPGLHELRKTMEISPVGNPVPALLTKGKDSGVDFSHPFFHSHDGETFVTIMTPDFAAEEMFALSKRSSVPLPPDTLFLPVEGLTPSVAIDVLSNQFGGDRSSRLLIEAGPMVGDQLLSKVSTLYLTILEGLPDMQGQTTIEDLHSDGRKEETLDDNFFLSQGFHLVHECRAEVGDRRATLVTYTRRPYIS